MEALKEIGEAQEKALEKFRDTHEKAKPVIIEKITAKLESISNGKIVNTSVIGQILDEATGILQSIENIDDELKIYETVEE